MDTLTLVMINNVFTFGDTYWKQETGAAIGTPPAPPYATILFAIKEKELNHNFPQLSFYRCYLNSIFATWLPIPGSTANEERI